MPGCCNTWAAWKDPPTACPTARQPPANRVVVRPPPRAPGPCKAAIQKYCRNVKVGEGRVADCLTAQVRLRCGARCRAVRCWLDGQRGRAHGRRPAAEPTTSCSCCCTWLTPRRRVSQHACRRGRRRRTPARRSRSAPPARLSWMSSRRTQVGCQNNQQPAALSGASLHERKRCSLHERACSRPAVAALPHGCPCLCLWACRHQHQQACARGCAARAVAAAAEGCVNGRPENAAPPLSVHAQAGRLTCPWPPLAICRSLPLPVQPRPASRMRPSSALMWTPRRRARCCCACARSATGCARSARWGAGALRPAICCPRACLPGVWPHTHSSAP